MSSSIKEKGINLWLVGPLGTSCASTRVHLLIEILLYYDGEEKKDSKLLSILDDSIERIIMFSFLGELVCEYR